MTKSIFYFICSLRAATMASAHSVGSNVGGNRTSMIDESLYLRRLRGYGNRGGMGMGMAHNGGMMNGGSSGRMEIMRTIHNLFADRGSIMREVNQTNDGVETYTYSDNDQVTTWIVNHVTQMARLMEEGSGIRLWDDLFEKAFEYRHMNHLSFTEEENGVRVTHAVNNDVNGQEKECIVAIIHEHAGVVSDFISRGMVEAHSNHAVPKECSGV